VLVSAPLPPTPVPFNVSGREAFIVTAFRFSVAPDDTVTPTVPVPNAVGLAD